jgi:hypothetical protein
LTDAKISFGNFLQTLYKEASLVRDKEKGEGFGLTNPIVDALNNALKQAGELFPEKRQQIEKEIASIERAPSHFGIDAVNTAKGRAQEALLAIVRLAQILQIPLKEPPSSQVPLVQLAITQQVSQFISFSFDQLIQAIQQQQIEQQVKTDAEDAVKQFREEIAKPRPEPSKLKSYLTTVMKVGKEFAVPLLMKLMENWDKIFPPK